MRYRRRPSEVEAIRWDDDTARHMPPWLTGYVDDGMLGLDKRGLYGASPDGSRIYVCVGDYIVNDDGNISIMPSDAFEREYEVVRHLA